MRTASILAALSCAATTYAQAVEIGIAPKSPPPEGCDKSPKGNFTIGYIPASSLSKKRDTTATADAEGSLYLTLEDGILTDGWNRTGSVVANHQFQFDGPPQAGAIYTGGFSVCQNKSLAIGGTARWWNCLSGTFNNLYDESIGDQCQEIRIVAQFVDQPTIDEPTAPSSSAAAESTSKATSDPSTVVTSTSTGNGTTATITSSKPPGSSSTLSTIPLTSINGTRPSGSVSTASSATPTANSPEENAATSAPDAPGAAAPSAVTQGATLGAVIGVLAAALIL